MGRNFYNLYIVITSLEDPGAATLVNLVYIVVYESHVVHVVHVAHFKALVQLWQV